MFFSRQTKQWETGINKAWSYLVWKDSLCWAAGVGPCGSGQQEMQQCPGGWQKGLGPLPSSVSGSCSWWYHRLSLSKPRVWGCLSKSSFPGSHCEENSQDVIKDLPWEQWRKNTPCTSIADFKGAQHPSFFTNGVRKKIPLLMPCWKLLPPHKWLWHKMVFNE